MHLGEILMGSGALSAEQLKEGLTLAQRKGVRLGEALVEAGFADEATVFRALAKQAGLRFVDLEGRKPSRAALDALPDGLARDLGVLPVADKDGSLFVAIGDPAQTVVADSLAFQVDRDVVCVMAAPRALKAALEVTYGEAPAAPPGAGALRGAETPEDVDSDAPVVRFVEQTLETALDARASDVHLEPYEDRLRVRYRVDGVLLDAGNHPPHLNGPVISRIKIMAGLDIAEKRRPQDGRILHVGEGGRQVDIRVSILPSNHGETVVMRLLDRSAGLLSLRDLGFGDDDYRRFQRLIARPNGMLLVTGPTGSGKTTTLYAALSDLNQTDTKVITAEDPVEYHLDGINQVQVSRKAGLGFTEILRSILRQAPNIILIGEIRDKETAEIAVQAALTGHLVLSTLHTNDAASALTRLVDMGVPPFLASASIHGVLAQRLLRTLCAECAVKTPADASELQVLGLSGTEEEVELARPRGCAECGGSGFRGRVGIFELLEMDDTARGMVFAGESHWTIREHGIRAGLMSTLFDDGKRKVLDGRVSIEELMGATMGEWTETTEDDSQ